MNFLGTQYLAVFPNARALLCFVHLCEEPAEAKVSKVVPADMETGKMAKDAFLKVREGDKVLATGPSKSKHDKANGFH